MAEVLKLNLTLPAMERLIGGDSEIQLGLRQGICSEFAKRHLQHLLSEEMAKVVSELREELRRAACEGVVSHLSGKLPVSSYVYLDSELVSGVKECVAREVQEAIRSTALRIIDERLARFDFDGPIRRRVEDSVKLIADAQITAAIKARVASVIANL